MKAYFSRLNGTDNLDPHDELRREVWRTITRSLASIPTLRANVLVTGVLSNLIDDAPKETLVAILVALDITSAQLLEEADRIR